MLPIRPVHSTLALALVATVLTVPAVLPATTTRSPVFFGIAVPSNDFALIDAAAADSGAVPAVNNIFVKLDSPSFNLLKLQQIGARGMRPMVTLEPWSYRSLWGRTALPEYSTSRIAAGAHDAVLRAVAGVVAQYGGPLYFRFAHEMNGWWYPWAAGQNGNSALDYIAAWRHVHRLFREEGAGNAQFLWAPNALTGSGRETPLEFLYPGDPYVDLVGMTAYGHGSSPAQTFDPTYARLAALTGKPIVLAETGVDGPGKEAWIAAFGRWLADRDRVAGFVWFNTTPATTGASGDYRFNDTDRHIAAFRMALAQVRLGFG